MSLFEAYRGLRSSPQADPKSRMFPLSTTRCTGYIKLTDLGMAQAVPKGGTVSGKSGTRGFWPPEMIRRQPYRFEPDWWTRWSVSYTHLTLPTKA